MAETTARFKEELAQVQEEIYELAGETFNINSPKQLGVILFEKLNLPIIKKTKTGYSTDAEVLDMLRHESPIVEKSWHTVLLLNWYLPIAKDWQFLLMIRHIVFIQLSIKWLRLQVV